MKYVFQLGIICAVTFVAELLYALLPLPIPASIYGLVLLFALLETKIVKLEQIQDVAGFFLAAMPIFYIAPSVSLITSFDEIKGQAAALVAAAFISTIGTMVVTGWISQGVVRLIRKYKNKKDKGDQ